MLALSRALLKDAEFKKLLQYVESARPVAFSGLGGIHRAHVAAAIRRQTGRPVLLLCPDEQDAGRTAADVSAFTQETAKVLPAREFTFYNAESVSRELEQRRLAILGSLTRGQAGVVVATADALMQRTLPKEKLLEAAFELRCGQEIPPETVAARLIACGYSRSQQVEGYGQFSIRGGILDVYSPSEPLPVRCEFFGDEIDSMGCFDLETQRRLENLSSTLVLPTAECLAALYDGGEEGFAEELQELLKKVSQRKNPKAELIANLKGDIERLREHQSFPAIDRYMEPLYREMATAADYLPPDTVVLLCEPKGIAERVKNYVWQSSQDVQTLLENGVLEGSIARFYRPWDELLTRFGDFSVVMLDSFTGSSYPIAPKALLNLAAKQLPSYGGSIETAAGDIVHYMKDGYATVVLCADQRRVNILLEYLREHGIPAAADFNLTELPPSGSCAVGIGAVSAGMEYPGVRLAVITEGQIIGSLHRTPRKKHQGNRQKVQSYADLSPGDLVVHEYHGIGRFVGMFKIPVDGVEKDYIKIAYAGTDSLYVPATQLDLVAKYIGGGEGAEVRLSRMGGADWQRAKSRAKAAAKDMAKELIALYAERQRRPGYSFSPDTPWQTEFEENFGYRETDDQLRAIAEVKADMERSQPMDRLLCGDVGFGKTEVALRAVMKCVLDSKQAAILVPTTVLAQQHYVTAMKRFAGYPIRIEVLSRFRTPVQMKEAVKNIRGGSADIIIGTHRLLQKDVVFRDLGLLVVDEEQRFGVTHKERLKEIAKQVDVLTLTATPIPRTLNMALSGMRDMSTLEEPPSDRHPVQTYVLEHDWSIVADAIRREVGRGGQVYYLHNRVESIDRTAARIAGMIEGVSVAVAHGQMDEESLSSVMERMASGEVQVLVCTTIIETGIDIPNVNTLIIEDADRLGMAQLHQIRGRVGRSSRHAFAYLTFRRGKVLSDIATKRLSAIREFAEFNSGFRIAMRDLEIRGAGNLLGSEQSGHMMSVGYDMYLKLLEEAVLEEKGEKPQTRTECSADLTVSANIPESYVASGEQRMDLYRRIAQIRTEADADELTDELIDRFGDPPRSVNALIYVALLRGEAANAGISEIAQKAGQLSFTLTDFNMEKISRLYSRAQFKGRIRIEAGAEPRISLRIKAPKDVIGEAVALVRAYADI